MWAAVPIAYKLAMKGQRTRKRSDTKPAAHALIRLLKDLGLTDQARKLRISSAWAQAVGPEIASRTEPQSFNRGVLVVKSNSAAWQNELTFLKAEIIEKVNLALEGVTVRDLKIVGGQVTPRLPVTEMPRWVTDRPTQEDEDIAHDASLPISDPDLKKTFERVVMLDLKRQRIRKKQ